MANELADNLASIIDEIEAQIKLVPDVGNVHDHDRHVPDWDSFFGAFSFTDKLGNHWAVRGCTITRESTTDDREVFANSWTRIHHMVVKVYHSIEDKPIEKNQNTDRIFQRLVEDICQQLATWAKNTALGYKLFGSLPTVRTVDIRTFGSHECHYAEIAIAAWTRVIDDNGTWTVQA